MSQTNIKNDREMLFLHAVLHKSGEVASNSFGKVSSYSLKDDPNQVVSVVDRLSEKLFIDSISQMYPEDSIIAEESGYIKRNGPNTWIIDPIDGSSNYVLGLPWFGVMAACVDVNFVPISAGIYLPLTKEIVIAQRGAGAFYNGQRIYVKPENDLSKCLVSVCADSSSDAEYVAKVTNFYKDVLSSARNIRSTNSSADYFYASVGKLGALVNFSNKIWDIAPIALIAAEAGMKVSDVNGQAIDLLRFKNDLSKSHSLVCANPGIFEKVLSYLK